MKKLTTTALDRVVSVLMDEAVSLLQQHARIHKAIHLLRGDESPRPKGTKRPSRAKSPVTPEGIVRALVKLQQPATAAEIAAEMGGGVSPQGIGAIIRMSLSTHVARTGKLYRLTTQGRNLAASTVAEHGHTGPKRVAAAN